MVAAPGQVPLVMDVLPSESSALAVPSPVRSWYPVRVRLREGTEIAIRPIGPDDAEREQTFIHSLSPQSRYFRFMNTLRELPPDMLYRFTHPDFQHEIALVALVGEGAAALQIGVARFAADPGRASAEFAVAVADKWQNRGVGSRLLCELLRAARAVGINQLRGDILASNSRMLALMAALGFDIQAAPEDPSLRRAVKTVETIDGSTVPSSIQGP
jgi:acetyltransferase